jgi:hypothetical protein
MLTEVLTGLKTKGLQFGEHRSPVRAGIALLFRDHLLRLKGQRPRLQLNPALQGGFRQGLSRSYVRVLLLLTSVPRLALLIM